MHSHTDSSSLQHVTSAKLAYLYICTYYASGMARLTPASALQIDQLTVNEYQPGVGLSPHVDAHSAFTGAITSLTLGSACVMEFWRGDAKVPVHLPQRSLLVMAGESRYAWYEPPAARLRAHDVSLSTRCAHHRLTQIAEVRTLLFAQAALACVSGTMHNCSMSVGSVSAGSTTSHTAEMIWWRGSA